jgi:aminoglycoside phosphotransferase (APT) family kinase protein
MIPQRSVPIDRESLRQVCRLADVDHRGAVHLRSQSNETWLLPRAGVVVRLSLRSEVSAAAATMMRLIRGLQENGFPVAAPWSAYPGPLVLPNGRTATLWRALEVPERRDYAAFGRLLKRLHAAPVSPEVLPNRLDPVALASAILREDLPYWGMDRPFVEDRMAELTQAVGVARWPLPPGLVHGDAHIGNVLLDRGRPVLSDWDAAAIGNPGWDLLPTAVEPQRWSRPVRDYRSFVRGYQQDVTGWPGYRVLRELAEWHSLAERIRVAAVVPRAGRNLRLQLATMRTGKVDLPWYGATVG